MFDCCSQTCNAASYRDHICCWPEQHHNQMKLEEFVLPLCIFRVLPVLTLRSANTKIPPPCLYNIQTKHNLTSPASCWCFTTGPWVSYSQFETQSHRESWSHENWSTLLSAWHTGFPPSGWLNEAFLESHLCLKENTTSQTNQLSVALYIKHIKETRTKASSYPGPGNSIDLVLIVRLIK